MTLAAQGGQNGLFLRNLLQDLHEEVPPFLDGRDIYTLIRGMRAEDGRTAGNHVPMRVGAAEDATFESGMNGHDGRFLPVHAAVDFLHGVKDEGIAVWSPTGIAAGK